MATKKAAKKKEIVTDEAAAPKKAKVTGPTDGIFALGKVGKAAREAAQDHVSPPPAGVAAKTWRDPNWTPAENDTSIDARMSRLTKELRG